MKMANDLIIRDRDRLPEISMKLEQSHLVYLQTDDSPLKLQQRHKLEGFIKEYLCLVPNESKYVFQETADILHRSAATLQDFSGYRAATAWSAISLYAANLLAQPWRKEYRTLRTYSGYYKHEVEANLIGAELMFEQMGYKHTGLGVLTLEGPIDPDKVSSVSRDAIVAFVECQILKQIWESVSQKYTVSWLEVLEFRENHVCTPEQAIRALNYHFIEKMHQNRTKPETYRDYHYSLPTSIDTGLPTVPYHIMPINYNMTMPACQTEHRYIEEANAIPSNYQYYQPMEHSLMNRCSAYECLPHGNKYYTGIHPSSYCSTMPAYTTGVPTGRLIEVDVPMSVANYDKLHNRKAHHKMPEPDEVDFYRRQSSGGDNYEYGKVEKKPSKSGTVDKSGYGTWDYVHKRLESIGYSKDLGEREDILHKREVDSQMTKQKSHRHNENEDKYNTHHFEKRKVGKADVNEIEPSLTNGRNLRYDTLPFKKKSSSFDLSDSTKYHANMSSENTFTTHSRDTKHSSQTLPIQHSHRSSDQIAKITDSLKNYEISHLEKEAIAGNEDRWNCATCTFLNPAEKVICEMCGKSRHKGNEDKPLASGGKECPYCTLVNEKNVSKCEACGKNLKDSPTYI